MSFSTLHMLEFKYKFSKVCPVLHFLGLTLHEKVRLYDEAIPWSDRIVQWPIMLWVR